MTITPPETLSVIRAAGLPLMGSVTMDQRVGKALFVTVRPFGVDRILFLIYELSIFLQDVNCSVEKISHNQCNKNPEHY